MNILEEKDKIKDDEDKITIKQLLQVIESNNNRHAEEKHNLLNKITDLENKIKIAGENSSCSIS
tara:strand:- start:1334 stop:1525 length:192 start_codon:yes stop_codon:yes gene_type:complete